jgi:hypothetical protein
MSSPTLQERKEFWLRCFADECFQNAKATCDFLLKHGNTVDGTIAKVLASGFVVTYGKPFTTCHGVGKLDETIIPKQFKTTHAKLMELRHKMVAHIDALNFQSDDKNFGNINQVRLTVTKKKYWFHGYVIYPETLDLKTVNPLITRLIESNDYHLEKFKRRYVEKNCPAPGEYLLDISEAKSNFFTRLKTN